MSSGNPVTPFDGPNSYVGRVLSRPGARRAVAGRGRYTDDIALPRMVHAAFVRSPYGHARIVDIDTAAAAAHPGVVRAMTGAELARHCPPWSGMLTSFEGMKAAEQHAMATDRACWQGEPVAVVCARTRAEAEDAAELVEIEWEELPVVIDKERALGPGATVLHPELGDNLAWRRDIDNGDVDAAFAAEGAVTVEETYEFGRHTAVSLEPRALLAAWDPGAEKLTVYTSSQVPHMIKTVFARHLPVDEHNIRIVAPDVGGSFGLKIHTYGDEVAVCALAILLNRPVKFVADRLESFVTDIHARENRIRARMALTREGEITALEIDDLSGVGAYSQYPRTSVFEANQILNIAGGPYRHANYRAVARIVYLNGVPTSQYRGVGHPIGISASEALLDLAAGTIGMDPVELRRRNLMEDDSYPRKTASGVHVQDLSHQACLEQLVERIGYAELRAEQQRLRADGVWRGIGVCCFIKGTAPGPEGYYGAGKAPIASQDACTMSLEPGGGVLCAVGVTEQGQGADAVMRQIAATAVGVPIELVRVISGDTDAVPYGGGTYASRATAIGGEATWLAGRALRAEILRLAGALLQTAPERLDVAAGEVVDEGGGTPRISLAEIGRIGHFQVGELPNDIQPELTQTRHFRLRDRIYIFTNGAHASHVEVDVETGMVRLLDHWVVEDCGRVINPMLADEQVRGGAVQGIGGGLYEHCIYDANAQLQNGTMVDYLTPMALEMPDIDVAHVETLTAESELGAKGVGESGVGGAPSAVMNAINDALKPFGARVTDHPITPETVLRALGWVA